VTSPQYPTRNLAISLAVDVTLGDTPAKVAEHGNKWYDEFQEAVLGKKMLLRSWK
jgi:hypothetical protein